MRVSAVLVGLLIAVVVILGVGWWYFDRTATTWEGDRTFQVTRVPDTAYSFDTFGVKSTDKTPEGADTNTGAQLSESVDRDKMPADVAVGDTVVCHVVETYRLNTDIANGPQSHVTSCHR